MNATRDYQTKWHKWKWERQIHMSLKYDTNELPWNWHRHREHTRGCQAEGGLCERDRPWAWC